MRKLFVIALMSLVVLLGSMPLSTAPARAETATVAAAEAQGRGPFYPVAVGLGAIAGVVAYNIANFGTAGVPLLAPAATTGAMVTAAAIAQNRLYTVVSAVVGGLVANWLYGN